MCKIKHKLNKIPRRSLGSWRVKNNQNQTHAIISSSWGSLIQTGLYLCNIICHFSNVFTQSIRKLSINALHCGSHKKNRTLFLLFYCDWHSKIFGRQFLISMCNFRYDDRLCNYSIKLMWLKWRKRFSLLVFFPLDLIGSLMCWPNSLIRNF